MLALLAAVCAGLGAWSVSEHFTSEPEDLYACIFTAVLALVLGAGCWIVERRLHRAV